MSGEEISRLTKALSELGVCKIRLTGGEPTVRKDFFDILKDMKQNSNIPKITMTTNGYRLNKIAKQLYNYGLDGINISIDSLNRETFKKLTGHDRLPEILEGIKILQNLNFKNIKVKEGRLEVSCSPVEKIIVSGYGSASIYKNKSDMEAAVFNLALLPQKKWLRITLIDKKGNRAWTNPIYDY